ncbi:MAG: T9SS type A sorting domain-containing protein [Hydrotalea flava]|nr:T9SS type A sorting domain-containing protein [Hydrotalea flava]NIM37170.1 T9SS type A sorting domain-containing protein [Hydrotalea flava]NIN02363.1 T9SS type A sorting domain-containing protein [Hydrotalea flava]NIN14015.1 T9SS type A sorting domain-containing protein [Hydrotalea flava]NIO93096.1 T9SS type A sorting domain-containing protein [Hydrotalea flava]
MFNKNINSRLQIQLMDLNGQILQQQVAEQVNKGQVISLPIQNLPAGTYMLRVAHKDGTTVKQILKY